MHSTGTSPPKRCLWLYLTCLATIVTKCCCYQIMFLPLSERTHMLVHLKLATALAARGNTVQFITADCHRAFVEQTMELFSSSELVQLIPYSMDCSYHEREKAAARLLSRFGEVAAIYRNVVGRADDILSNASLMQQLERLAPQTDIMVSDLFSFGMLLAAKLGIQHIDLDVGTAGSLWEPVLYGADSAASYVPAVGSFLPTNGMSLAQRALNLASTTVIRTLIRLAFWHPGFSLQQVLTKHKVPIKWPYTHAMMVLVNSNFALEPPRAIPPNIQYVGPILPEPPRALPVELDSFLAAAGETGAVLVSFGGTLNAPLTASLTLLRAYEALPQVRFVWKLSASEQAAIGSIFNVSRLSNVYVSSWLPQNDLLGDPRVKAFITQGGYLSMGEAAYHGVPVLGLPFIPGQGELIQFAKDQGRAIHLHSDTLARGDAAAVVGALQALLTDGSYQAAAQVVSRRLKAAQRPQVDVAADWVEYAAAVKHDGPFLHPQSLQQRWYQQALLDVLLLYKAVAGVLVLLLAKLVRWQLQRVLQCDKRGCSKRQAGQTAEVVLRAKQS